MRRPGPAIALPLAILALLLLGIMVVLQIPPPIPAIDGPNAGP